MQDNASSNKTKNYGIQVLRGILCLMIIFFHYFYRYGQIYDIVRTTIITNNAFVGSFGEFGVLCFFIISGLFTNVRNIDSKREKLKFWIKKYLSIYLVYVVTILIIYLVSQFGGYGNGRTANLGDMLQNLIFLNQITGAVSVDSAHWYIFYLFVIFVWMMLLNIVGKEKSCVIISILICLNFLLFSGSLILTESARSICYLAYRLMGSKYLGMLLVGYIWRLYENKKNKSFLLVWGINICILGLESIASNRLYLIMIPCAICVVGVFYYNVFAFLAKQRVFILLGDASLSIYLLHQNIGYLLINKMKVIIGYYPSAIIVLLSMTIVGISFFIVIEKPIKHYVNQLLR